MTNKTIPTKKWEVDGSRNFSKEKFTNGHIYEKIISITDDQGKKNQNYNEISYPVTLAITNKTQGNKCWQGCGEKEIFVHCWLRM